MPMVKMYMYMLKLNGNQPVVAYCTRGCCVAHKKEGYRIVYVLKLKIGGINGAYYQIPIPFGVFNS